MITDISVRLNCVRWMYDDVGITLNMRYIYDDLCVSLLEQYEMYV